jgi:transposase
MSQKSTVPSNTNPRFVACDISKHSVVVAAVDSHQQILLPPRKFTLAKFEQWVAEYLQPTDKVVLEATGDAWYYYDLLQPKVAKVVVANPAKIGLIAQSRVKTDAKDATILPGCWQPT